MDRTNIIDLAPLQQAAISASQVDCGTILSLREEYETAPPDTKIAKPACGFGCFAYRNDESA